MNESEVLSDGEDVGVARDEKLRRREGSPASWVDRVGTDQPPKVQIRSLTH